MNFIPFSAFMDNKCMHMYKQPSLFIYLLLPLSLKSSAIVAMTAINLFLHGNYKKYK